MNVIFVIGIFMSFFIALLLFTKKGKTLPDKTLTVWVFAIGIHLLSYYLYFLGFWEKYPHLIGVTAPFPLLHGPLLFLYARFSLSNEARIRYYDYAHFAPFVLAYLYMSRFFFFYSAEEKNMVDTGMVDDFTIFSGVLLGSFVVSGLGYTIVAYRFLTRHRQIVDANFSYDEKLTLDWVKAGIYGLGLIFFTVTVIIILREAIGLSFPFNADLIFYTMIIVLIFLLGYFGIRQRNIFNHELADEVVVPENINSLSKYSKTGLGLEAAQEIHRKLKELMHREKPFLDPLLTLSSLSQFLDLSPNQLSQVINQFEEINFHDFVNTYRIEEFVQKSSIDTHLNILGLALDSGFNSKSSFNAVFKKHKGVTPSQFLKSNKVA